MNPRNIDFWEKLLQNLPESYREWFKEERNFLRVSIRKNASVLEIGCGDGRSLRDIVDITSNLTGIDNDAKAVSDAKKNFEGNARVKILQANAEKLPFENESFDYVICMTTFANFGDKKYKVIEEMKRVLKNDGRIIISVYNENALEERKKMYDNINAKIKKITENGTVLFDETGNDIISEQFSQKQLLQIFGKAGLHLEEIKKVGIAYICSVKK